LSDSPTCTGRQYAKGDRHPRTEQVDADAFKALVKAAVADHAGMWTLRHHGVAKS